MNNAIKEIRLYRAVSDISQPIADSTHDISDIAFYVAEVITRGGTRGQGYLLSFHYSPGAIRGALKDIAAFALARGYETGETLRFLRDWDRETEYFGAPGLQRWAAGAINVAMWDAWAKALDVPIWRLLGGSSKRIPIYGSGGWLSYSDAELLAEVMAYKKRGFTAVKIKVGSPDIRRDIERLARVREAVGPDLRIMMDANQGMDLPAAVELSLRAEKLGIYWFEEPIANTDFDGYATLRGKTSISLAMGEREYSLLALRELAARNAIDLWQPDLLRLGGVEAWRASAVYAQAHHIPILPHYYKDYDVPLLCTVDGAYGAESFDWIDNIIDNKMPIDNGFAVSRTGPGWGFSFLEKHLEAVE